MSKRESVGVPMDPVDLDVIGDINGGKPAAEEIAERLRELSHKVLDPRSDGKGTLTLKIAVKRTGNGSESALFVHDISVKEPRIQRTGIVAHRDPKTGDMLTSEHRQLSVDNVTALKGKV